MRRGGNAQSLRGFLIVGLLLGILIGISALSGYFSVNQKPGAVWLVIFKVIIAVGLGMAVYRLFILRLATKLEELTQLLQEAQFDARVNQTKFCGLSRQLAQTVNQLLDKMREKQLWYEGILDAIPILVQAMDNNLNWTFMNRRFERFMIMTGISKDRQSSYGAACSRVGSTVCNTEKCGVKQLQRGNSETFFKWHGKDYKLDAAPLKNNQGEQTGFVEVITDLTATLRVNDYIKAEVNRIEANLQMLAEGNLDLNLFLKEADEFTSGIKEQFERINN
ncbi:MAG TPA: hypothetical protein VEC37_11060, partial [Bacillota bacterium]|nr:hypothetical protein [Bacillota bacterium]